jgi:hypothetical protein
MERNQIVQRMASMVITTIISTRVNPGMMEVLALGLSLWVGEVLVFGVGVIDRKK